MTLEEARQAANDYLQSKGEKAYAFRSCWNCNAAHDHLKEYDAPILCMICSRWYYKGMDITE